MDSLYIFGAKYLWILSVLVAGYYFWQSEKKTNLLRLGVLALPLAFIIAKILNHFYNNPRPFVVEGFTPLIQHVADNGFPSDHVLLVATIASVVLVFDKRFGIALWLITLLVAISRVLVGVHHTIDVLGSIGISMIAVGVVYFSYKINAARSSAKPQ